MAGKATLYLKNRKDDEGNNLAVENEFIDFNIRDNTLILIESETSLILIPNAEYEMARIDLYTEEQDAPDKGDDNRPDSDEPEVNFDFTGGSDTGS